MIIYLNDSVLYKLVLGFKLQQQKNINKGYMVITEFDKQAFVKKLTTYLKTIQPDLEFEKTKPDSFFKVFNTEKPGKNYLQIQKAIFVLVIELKKYLDDEVISKVISDNFGQDYFLEEDKTLCLKK